MATHCHEMLWPWLSNPRGEQVFPNFGLNKYLGPGLARKAGTPTREMEDQDGQAWATDLSSTWRHSICIGSPPEPRMSDEGSSPE